MKLKELVELIVDTPSIGEEDHVVSPDIVARDQDGNWYNVTGCYINGDDDMVMRIEKRMDDL